MNEVRDAPENKEVGKEKKRGVDERGMEQMEKYPELEGENGRGSNINVKLKPSDIG